MYLKKTRKKQVKLRLRRTFTNIMKKSPNSELEKHSNTIPLKKRNENQRKTKKRTNNYKSLMKKKPLSINPWKILTKINQK